MKKFSDLVEDAKIGVMEISIHDVGEKIINEENVHIVDVREDNEWEKGHICGAIHLSRGIIERDIGKIIKDAGAEIVLYCARGYRSVLAAESLMKMGYRNVKSMIGGYKEWEKAGHLISRE